jgi:hypothetical protein
MDYEDTVIWRRLLDTSEDDHARDLLKGAYRQFHENATQLADEIRTTMPSLTEHGAPHLDAVWEMADLIARDTFELTPAEVFAFGGAVLLHDLGLGLAAYPGGIDALRTGDGWSDSIALVLRQRFGRFPSTPEIAAADDAVQEHALAMLLRSRHAAQAAKLGTARWNAHGTPLYLIESVNVRAAFGEVIGQIAASHWADVSDLPGIFKSVVTAMPGSPPGWIVRPLRLAALLRVADAAHLDSRRAPSWLLATRRPEGVALEHWIFQNKLNTPYVSEGKLLYTSGAAFALEDTPAWWRCFEALTVCDRELADVDELLSSEGDPRLTVTGVVDVQTPLRLAKHVSVRGWEPVDIAVGAKDAIGIVRKLGGAALYGSGENFVPLRELIQNASDAVRARRSQENRASDWGQVTISVATDSADVLLRVQDNGVGMSSSTLTRTLLDFGASLWTSEALVAELPGLAGSGFEATGRFGIGFFSVFMWTDRVRITTRHFRDGPGETKILEFPGGLESRPVLRPAEAAEVLPDPGTIVELRLDANATLPSTREMAWEDEEARWTEIEPEYLAEICDHLCPTIDVDLEVKVQGSALAAVTASDWTACGDDTLLARTDAKVPGNLTNVLSREGETIGRARLSRGQGNAVVTVGGFRAARFPHADGVFIGDAPNLARDRASAVLDQVSFEGWLSQQLKAQAGELSPEWSLTALAYGWDVGDIPVCSDNLKSVTLTELSTRVADQETVIFVYRDAIEEALAEERVSPDQEVALHDSVYLLPRQPISFSTVGFPAKHKPDLLGVIREVIAESWKADPGSIGGDSDLIEIGESERDEEVRAVAEAVLTRLPA